MNWPMHLQILMRVHTFAGSYNLQHHAPGTTSNTIPTLMAVIRRVWRSVDGWVWEGAGERELYQELCVTGGLRRTCSGGSAFKVVALLRDCSFHSNCVSTPSLQKLFMKFVTNNP
jgi:hypothetical protein